MIHHILYNHHLTLNSINEFYEESNIIKIMSLSIYYVLSLVQRLDFLNEEGRGFFSSQLSLLKPFTRITGLY